MNERADLMRYHSRLLEGVRRAIEYDNYYKSAEGAVKITLPSIFEAKPGPGQSPDVTMEVYCYVLGPARHYTYTGATIEQCVLEASDDLDRWLEELEADIAEEAEGD